MGQKVTFGGKRLGSGGGIDIYMDGYHASNHDLGFVFRSTMDAGTLVPCLKLPMIIGDNFDIDTKALIKTLPTGSPSFGKFKYQIDFFFCPNRLYMGPLHNNATGIGRNMGKVILPTIKFPVPAKKFKESMDDPNQEQIAPDSLVAYMGIRGLGENITSTEQTREFNGIPFLAYPDIFKNFYANQQEKNAYIINAGNANNSIQAEIALDRNTTLPATGTASTTRTLTIDWNVDVLKFNESTKFHYSAIIKQNNEEITDTTLEIGFGETKTFVIDQDIELKLTLEPYSAQLASDGKSTLTISKTQKTNTDVVINWYDVYATTGNSSIKGWPQIKGFPLENIDQAREIILANSKIGTKVSIGETEKINFSPYVDVTLKNTIYQFTKEWENTSKQAKCGLLLRTYMGDVFNNWVKTEWIDEINAATMIKTDATGAFSMDALIVAKRTWEYRNRVEVSGGTYQDWMEATYGRNAQSFCESPIYMGGASGTISFDEVISTAGEDSLGELGGRGISFNHKGGKINVKAQEHGYLIGIVSIVPFVDYYQGNDWDMTELTNMESYHMPQFDGIGFQDLITERLVAWDTKITTNGQLLKKSVGKQPAWSQYMTNYNKVFGDFCKGISTEPNNQYAGIKNMVITREYQGIETTRGLEIKDLTTYVFPELYNYLFVSKNVEFNPFWVQIGFDIFARRLMSAAVMPHL